MWNSFDEFDNEMLGGDTLSVLLEGQDCDEESVMNVGDGPFYFT